MEKIDLNRRSISTNLINNQIIQTSYTSTSIRTEFYRNFVLYLSISSIGTPTDILFDVQFSDDNMTFYKLTDDFYGMLRYEDTATVDGITESMTHIIQGRYIRLVATVTGGDVNNYFIVTAKIEFHN